MVRSGTLFHVIVCFLNVWETCLLAGAVLIAVNLAGPWFGIILFSPMQIVASSFLTPIL
jgi:hypothetical protein